MPDNKLKFTKTSIDLLPIPTKAKCGTAGFVSFWDTHDIGFGVRVRPSGTKTFILSYRTKAGRPRVFTVGKYGRLTVEQAREVARRLNGQVALGGDPTADQKEVRKASSVDELFARYTAEHVEPNCSENALRSVKRVRKMIKKLLGYKLVHEVENTDVMVAVKPYVLQRGNYNLVLTYVRAAWDWGRRYRVVPKQIGNPAEDLDLMSSRSTARLVTNTEYRRVMLAIDQMMQERRNDPARLLACLWCVYTGCRPIEAVRLRRDKVFQERGVAELWEHKTIKKTGQPKLFFLTDALIEILGRADALHKMRGVESEFVFPRRGKQKASNWLSKTWKYVQIRAKVDVDLRQFRSGYINAADELGLSDQQIADMTGHASLTTIRRHYKVVIEKRAAQNARRHATMLTAMKSANDSDALNTASEQ